MEFVARYVLCSKVSIKCVSFAVSASYQGTSRLGSAFFLRWFKLAHICIQTIGLHKADTSESIEQFFKKLDAE